MTLAVLMQACGGRNRQYDATGVFEAVEVVVSSESAGKIGSLAIEEGDGVEAGQVVGYVDTVQLYLRKLQLSASRKAVESRRPETGKQIAALEQQIATAQREKQRVENLLASEAANRKQLDDITAMIELLGKQLAAQKSTLAVSNRGISEESQVLGIQVAQVEDQLRKARITSPIRGIILARYAVAGELASPGKPLFKVGDTENMILRAYVTADQLARVKTGQEVRVFTDAGEENSEGYPGRITWISSKAEFTPKTIQTRNERANLVYAIKVAVRNDGYLKIGMYGEIRFRHDPENP